MPVRSSSLELALAPFAARGGTVAEVDLLRRVLGTLDDWALDHLAPHAFAERAGLGLEGALALLLRASEAGIVRLRYNTLCVFCGAIERRFEDEAAAPEASFRCEICDADIGLRNGERIEVAFHLAPALGKLAVDPFASMASYRRRFVSPSIVPSAEFAAYLARALRAQAIVAAGSVARLELELAPGASLRAVSYDRHGTVRVRARAGTAPPAPVELETRETGWSETAVHASSGTVELVVHNAGAQPTGVFVLEGDADAYHHAIGAHPPVRRPFLTARELWDRRAARTRIGPG